MKENKLPHQTNSKQDRSPRPRPEDGQAVIHGPSLLTEQDIYLFKEGTHSRLYEKLGSHAMAVDGRDGAHFAVSKFSHTPRIRVPV